MEFAPVTKEWMQGNVYNRDVLFDRSNISFSKDEAIKGSPLRYASGLFTERNSRRVVAKSVSDMWGIEPTQFFKPK